jgi:hypothetical protein
MHVEAFPGGLIGVADVLAVGESLKICNELLDDIKRREAADETRRRRT